jgi:hypothetical protein
VIVIHDESKESKIIILLLHACTFNASIGSGEKFTKTLFHCIVSLTYERIRCCCNRDDATEYVDDESSE